MTVDLKKFSPTLPSSQLETKYGLPKDILFCKRCVISNQRPNSSVEYKHTKDSKKQTINFDVHQICDACRLAEKKNSTIQWADREKELEDLCNRYRKNDGSYDCVVPGSGGKDSFYASHILKHKFGMHPLTVTWAPHLYTDWGLKNFHSWIQAGFDNILHTPNGLVHRLLTRVAVENLFHPFQPFMLGQKFFAPRIAAKYKIPLIFYGENEAEYGNPIEDTQTALRDYKYFSSAKTNEIFIAGASVASLVNEYGITTNDLQPYLPVDPEELKSNQIQVHYLGYYLKWHPQSCYYYAVEHSDFKASPERTAGTYSKYNSIDDKIDDFHYYTSYIKFGIGRATYDAAQEIRSGDITREEGVSLVRKYDGEWPNRFAEDIFAYLSVEKKDFPKAYEKLENPRMTRETFNSLTDEFRPPHLWKYENGAFSLRKTVWQE